jgi:hypothetical protein
MTPLGRAEMVRLLEGLDWRRVHTKDTPAPALLG